MKVQVAKLRDALDLVKPVVPRKPKLAVLSNVRLGDGEVLGGDLESAIVAALPEAQDLCLLPLEPITQLLKFVPGRDTLSINVKRGKLHVSWPDGSATYDAAEVDEYVTLPELEVDAEAEMAGDSLVAAISAVLPYCAMETSRPVLGGITAVFGDTIQIAAGDGFRMAYQTLPVSFPREQTMVIPSRAIGLLLHLWAKTPRTPPVSNDFIPVITAKKKLAIALANNGAVLRVGFGSTARLIIKLVQGSPPDWLKLFPKEKPVLQARILGADFERAVRRVRDVAKANKSIVRLEFSDNTMTVSAKAGSNEVKANVSLVDSEGEPNRVAIDGRYLLDYLNAKEGLVTLSMTDPQSPVSFQYQAGPRVLMMPMFVEWGDEPPAAKSEPEPVASKPEEPQETEEPAPEETAASPKKRREKK